MSHGTKLLLIPTRVRGVVAGATTRFEGVFTGLLTPIIPKIGGEPTREGLVELHQLVSGNMASVLLNLVGGQHGHLAMKMTMD